MRELGGTASGGATVNVTPGAVASLALAGGSGAIGVARPITIVAHDSYGNNISAYTGKVHMTSSDAAAVLPADVALVNGIATVNVTLMTVGTQTITATDVNDATISGTISSDALPVAARFVVEGFPSTTAGASQASPLPSAIPSASWRQDSLGLSTSQVPMSGRLASQLHIHDRGRRQSHFLGNSENGWCPNGLGTSRKRFAYGFASGHPGDGCRIRELIVFLFRIWRTARGTFLSRLVSQSPSRAAPPTLTAILSRTIEAGEVHQHRYEGHGADGITPSQRRTLECIRSTSL